MIDTSKATVLYTTKGGYGVPDPDLKKWGLSDHFSPFKEFEIERDDSRLKTSPPAPGGEGLPRRQGRHALRHLPNRTRQAGDASSREKPCFSGDHPPEFDWEGLI